MLIGQKETSKQKILTKHPSRIKSISIRFTIKTAIAMIQKLILGEGGCSSTKNRPHMPVNFSIFQHVTFNNLITWQCNTIIFLCFASQLSIMFQCFVLGEILFFQRNPSKTFSMFGSKRNEWVTITFNVIFIFFHSYKCIIVYPVKRQTLRTLMTLIQLSLSSLSSIWSDFKIFLTTNKNPSQEYSFVNHLNTIKSADWIVTLVAKIAAGQGEL